MLTPHRTLPIRLHTTPTRTRPHDHSTQRTGNRRTLWSGDLDHGTQGANASSEWRHGLLHSTDVGTLAAATGYMRQGNPKISISLQHTSPLGGHLRLSNVPLVVSKDQGVASPKRIVHLRSLGSFSKYTTRRRGYRPQSI